MPRGVPKTGFRRSKNTAERMTNIKISYNETKETDAQIEAKLAERFDMLDVLAEACTLGNARALIVSGPSGLGKSYTSEQRLAEWDPNEVNHTIIKGMFVPRVLSNCAMLIAKKVRFWCSMMLIASSLMMSASIFSRRSATLQSVVASPGSPRAN